MTFKLPDLPYAKDALAPIMSAETLEFHHDKHHQTYVTNLNNLVAGTDMEGMSLEDLVRHAAGKPDLQGVFNNAGQHWNHIEFWNMMSPGASGMPSALESRIVADFGSVAAFSEAFVQAGATQFGSGWCWLVEGADGKLAVTKTANADNPLAHGQNALLGCDVWEHSYYIDYRNRRPDYIKAFLSDLVNWEYVASRTS